MNLSSKPSAPASGNRNWRTRLPRVLFWLALLAVLVLAILPNPPQLPAQPSDKAQHFAAFLCLTVLGLVAYPRFSPVKLAVGLAVFGALIETIQAVPALHRNADLLDWLVDVAATLCVVLALLVWRGLRGKV